MKEELSLPCPYKVSLDTSRNSYQFTTLSGAQYEVLFTLANEIFEATILSGVDAYNVVVNKLLTGNGLRDSNISLTVESIVAHFFIVKNRILAYSCDSDDGRHFARARMFNIWFEKSELEIDLIKCDYEIVGETVYKTSFIFHKDNDLGVENIVATLNELRDVLQDYK
jgi:hypothetical protein